MRLHLGLHLGRLVAAVIVSVGVSFGAASVAGGQAPPQAQAPQAQAPQTQAPQEQQDQAQQAAQSRQQGQGQGQLSPVPADVPKAAGFKKTTLVTPLENPWGLAFLPGGDMLVTERPGRLRLVRGGKLVEQPVAGLPKVLALSQGGLMDVALHPDFAQNKLVYFTYSTGTDQANRTNVGRGRLDLDAMQLRDVRELFKAQPDKPGGQHFGSNLLWLPDKTLLVSIGDGGNPPTMVEGILARENSQRLDRHLGKILRLDAEGKAPKDNPFVGRSDAKPEVWTWGNRNIQGMARDPVSGKVWSHEHGPRGGDEVNLMKPGANYGWPKASYGRDYQTRELVTPATSLPGMEDPKLVWVPSIAASGFTGYNGDKFPQWKGSLFAGGLVTQDVRRIKVEGEKITGQESLPIGRRVRAVVQGPDGFLYVLTDHKDGEIFRLEPEK